MLLFLCIFSIAHGHMGVSSPESRERPVVGDNYRFPGGGHCHGVTPGPVKHTYQSGSEVEIQISSGAAHNGGHCALFLARRSDNEAKWFKQMDTIDCTLGARNFKWKIEPSLVPSECKEACTLIWVWSPKSSGACEIYMNCFDIKIEGAVGAPEPSAVTINKNPQCIRIGANKQTPAFGEFCGTTCTRGTAAPTAGAPTPAPAPTAPAPTAAGNARCGATWHEANRQCLPSCTIENESQKCTGGTKCYADMLNLCEADINPNDPTVTKAKCVATGAWSGNPTITQWCAQNCPDVCPATHCNCDGNGPQFVSSSTTTYVPNCQKYSVKAGNETIYTITVEYDLASQVDFKGEAMTDDRIALANIEAAQALLDFNKGCDAISADTITTPLPPFTEIFITGDCQLTNDCPQSNDNSGLRQYSIFFNLAVILVMFLYHQL